MVAERENIQVTEEKELLQQRTQGSRRSIPIHPLKPKSSAF